MAVPWLFGNIPNGQTIPLSYLDEDFQYIENQIAAIPQGVLTISGGTTGLSFSPNVGNAIMTGVLNIANGGTGANTLAGLQTNIFPSQSGAAGQFLTTNGTTVSWAPGSSAGVTSFSGGTTGLLPNVATTGAISLAGTLAISNGGTGATTLAGLQANIFPSQAGHAGQVLSTDGSGTLSWIAPGGAAALTVGTTTITGGTTGHILYDNGAVLGEKTVTGTGSVVLDTTPLIVAAREKQNVAAIAGGVLAIDCNIGTILSINLNANITSVTFANVPVATNAYSVILSFTADGTARTITWPASVRWPNGTAPTMTSTAGKVDTLVLYTYDAGANWFGFISGQNA